MRALKVLLQRFEQRVPAQRLASAAGVRLKRLRTCVAGTQVMRTKVLVQEFQYLVLRAGHADVVDKRRVAQRRQPCLKPLRLHQRTSRFAFTKFGNRFDVDIQRIAEQPARRAVRARVPRFVRKHRVQRIDADDAGAARTPFIDDRCEVGEVADPPVALRAHCVQLDRRAPHLSRLRRRGNEAGVRSYCAAGLRDRLRAGDELDLVVSERQRCGQFELDIDQLAMARQWLAAHHSDRGTWALAAILGRHAHTELRFGQQCGQSQLQFPRPRVRAQHGQRRDSDCVATAFLQRRWLGTVPNSHRIEQLFERGIGHAVALTPDVVVFDGNAVRGGALRQHFTARGLPADFRRHTDVSIVKTAA